FPSFGGVARSAGVVINHLASDGHKPPPGFAVLLQRRRIFCPTLLITPFQGERRSVKNHEVAKRPNTLSQENVARVQHFFLQRVFLNTFFALKKKY
ncbi:MAG: hypothetical protein FWG79_02215, partial [Bacteroidales bacterium]|nr:hypothetical protein [Bacteroidales bacterium]